MTDKLITILNSLSEDLRNDETVKRYIAAKEAYLSDETTLSSIREYNVQYSLKTEEEKKENPDAAAIKGIEKRMEELMSAIRGSDTMKAMNESEADLDALLGVINNVISSAINPSSGCSGSCSSCGGCH